MLDLLPTITQIHSPVAKSEVENAKVSIRNARKEANNEIRKSDASEDMKSNFEIDIQNITDKYTSKIDSIFSTKEKEIFHFNNTSLKNNQIPIAGRHSILSALNNKNRKLHYLITKLLAGGLQARRY